MLKRILKTVGGVLFILFAIASLLLAVYAVFWMNQTVSENIIIFILSPIFGNYGFLMIKSAYYDCDILDIF